MTSLGQQMSSSQLSRIENGEVPIDDDQRHVLCGILQITEDALRGIAKKAPWYIVKKEVIEEYLRKLQNKEIFNPADDSPHKILIEKDIYQYAPCDESIVKSKSSDKEDVSLTNPMMRGYVIRIKPYKVQRTNEGIEIIDSDNTLASHSGEEIFYVLKGQMYFWFRQPDSEKVEYRICDEGDCLHFSSQINHGFSAVDEEAIVFVAYTDVQFAPLKVQAQAKV
jgi:mannose-6-phosphate isomerase-like protein (cupin superfamily)